MCSASPQSPLLTATCSGVGPADQLREHGVAVLAESPQVGRNLQNHLRFPLAYTCEAPVTAFQLKTTAAL